MLRQRRGSSTSLPGVEKNNKIIGRKMKIEQAKKVASASRRMVLSGVRAGKFQPIVDAILAFDLEHEKRRNEDEVHVSTCDQKDLCCRKTSVVIKSAADA